MTAVTITRVRGRTEFRSRYDAGVIALIKDVVPWQFREYDAVTKVWTVEDDYTNELVEALGRAGHFVGDTDVAPQPQTFWNAEELGEYALRKAAEILRDIPLNQHGAVFRAMARILYPDLYGRKT